MELFLKCCGGAILAVILILAVGNMNRDIALVLTIGSCCAVALVAMEYLRPVIGFVLELEQLAGLDPAMVRVLLKAVAIGLLTEIAALVCGDGGSGSLGKTLRILGSGVVLWLSLPLYRMLVELLQRVMGGL